MAPHAESPSRALGSSPNRSIIPRHSRPNRAEQSRYVTPTDPSDIHDLICIGFGPASLAIAVALHDAVEAGHIPHHKAPRVAFLERQDDFAWHAGMQLPGAKMQISWVKDLATLRNPRSHFTFLNYLHHQGRLAHFTNLGTFLPARVEYEDYMRWCAEHFTEAVHYSQDVTQVSPATSDHNDTITSFTIHSRNKINGTVSQFHARNVVIAVGGKPKIPDSFPQHNDRIIHSSRYQSSIPQLLQDELHPYKVLVIGSGQSAAETFHDVYKRFPNAQATLAIRGAALKPSDDSPFVNETFDPEQVDDIYSTEASMRAAKIADEKQTNYGVVRLELLEDIYGDLYEQRVRHPDPDDQRIKILRYREVKSVEESHKTGGLKVILTNKAGLYSKSQSPAVDDVMYVDAMVVAAGYERTIHEDMLANAGSLRPTSDSKWTVGRDYRVNMTGVSKDAGVYLQGCNEATHGLSDTLLSILAPRGGEMVDRIFGGLQR